MYGSSKAKTIEAYIEELDEPRKSEIAKLHRIIRKTVPKLEPTMEFGFPSYDKYHYKYASGREGDWGLIGVASNKNYISLYACAAKDGKYIAEGYKEQLPNASIGKSCVRFKKLEDIDLEELKKLLRDTEANKNTPVA